MTEYDIQRTARAVVDMLLEDDRFIHRMERMANARAGRMITTEKAAGILGISQYTMRYVAPFIGGIKKGSNQRAKWVFDESTLKERYLEYVNSKK